MSLKIRGFQFPEKIAFDEETLTNTYGKLIAEPLERGYGTTLGNSLRRALLSSIEGSAITQVRIPGVLHEFSTIKGVKEDMVDVILNLKKIRFKQYGDGKKVARIDVTGPKDVTGADIQCEANLEVLTTDLPVATVDKNAEFHAELYVSKGKGYVLSEMNKEKEQSVDIIAIDSVYSPIRKVNFRVEKARVGRATDYDRLVLEVWTDGSLSPKNALTRASSILIDHLDLFIFDESEEASEEISHDAGDVYDVGSSDFNRNLLRPVDELELSVRSYNCLKNANISTIADLVQRTDLEMLKTKNFGRKSLNEIKEILRTMGLNFGMKIDPEVLEKYQTEGGAVKDASQSS
ncbi:DNA-directed RNA polymerase subunit alpha [bacterium BMS3Bbin07]|nr:DNA-directed RNA polymerase subunit alpha [bacterium BMS3Bbin07]HDH01866.1 DNA-directed RNA polymerase subunit alpha [Nitrospirota bacterium]